MNIVEAYLLERSEWQIQIINKISLKLFQGNLNLSGKVMSDNIVMIAVRLYILRLIMMGLQ